MNPFGCLRARNRLLPRAADHECSPLDALELAVHLASCRGCRLEQRRQVALREEFLRLPEIAPPEDLPTRVMARVRTLRSGPRQIILAIAALCGSAGIWMASGGGASLFSPRVPIVPAVGRAAADAAIEIGRTLVLFLSEAPFTLLTGGIPPAPPLLNTLLILALGAGSLSLLVVAWLLALVRTDEHLDRR